MKDPNPGDPEDIFGRENKSQKDDRSQTKDKGHRKEVPS